MHCELLGLKTNRHISRFQGLANSPFEASSLVAVGHHWANSYYIFLTHFVFHKGAYMI